MLHKSYIVTYYKDGKYLNQITYDSQMLMKKELRALGARFTNSKFVDIDDDFVVLKGNFGFTFEIEELPEIPDIAKTIHYEGFSYIPIAEYCKRVGKSKRSVRYAINKNMLHVLSVGRNNLKYVRCDCV